MRASTLIAAAGLMCGLGLGFTPGHAAPWDAREGPGIGQPPAVRPPGPPPGANGAPARPLTDAELYRLLLVLSAQAQPPMNLLVACYPFGHPGWRDCITQR